MSSLHTLIDKYLKGNGRGALIRRNVLLSVGVKVGSIVCSLVLVPMTIDFVNKTQYGIWLTISSMVVWMSFFDVGFSNGMRNRLTEALAHNDKPLGKSFVSTTYAALSCIFAVLAVVLLLLVWLLPVTSLLNIDAAYEPELKWAATILVIYFCVGFVVRTLTHVLKADMRTAYGSLIEFVGQLGVLATIWGIKNCIEGSLTVLALALCIPPLLSWVISSTYLYATRYREIRPSFSFVRMEQARSLLNLGMKFFVISIAYVIQFQTSNFLIARLFAVSEVTSYNIAYKYFNVIYMSFYLLIDPFWSAVTDAWSRQEHEWIIRSTKRYLRILALWIVGGLVMLALADVVYDFWINSKVHEAIVIPFTLSAWMLAYVAVTCFSQIFCTVINGIGALKIQFYTSMISPLVFIGVTVFLAKVCGFGLESVLIGAIVANFNGLFLAPVQYVQILYRKKRGFWTA